MQNGHLFSHKCIIFILLFFRPSFVFGFFLVRLPHFPLIFFPSFFLSFFLAMHKHNTPNARHEEKHLRALREYLLLDISQQERNFPRLPRSKFFRFSSSRQKCQLSYFIYFAFDVVHSFTPSLSLCFFFSFDNFLHFNSF